MEAFGAIARCRKAPATTSASHHLPGAQRGTHFAWQALAGTFQGPLEPRGSLAQAIGSMFEANAFVAMAREWLAANGDLEAAGHQVPELDAPWRTLLASLQHGGEGIRAFATHSEKWLERQRLRLKEVREQEQERLNREKERLRAAEEELDSLESKLEVQEGLVKEAQMAKTILELLGPEERWEVTSWTAGLGESTLEELTLEPASTLTPGASNLMRATEEDVESETKSEHYWLHQILDEESRSSKARSQIETQ